ncbi:MAG: hypothetical protein FK731_13115 [Asgard group archaeon]|nr:hypothetical protein [Asgard group archaeon]
MIVKPFIATDIGEFPLKNNKTIKNGDKLRLVISMESSDPAKLNLTVVEIRNPLEKRVVTGKIPEIDYSKIAFLDVIIPETWIGGRYTVRVLDVTKRALCISSFMVEPITQLQKIITKQFLTPNWQIHYRLWARNPTDKSIGNFSAFVALPLTITPQQIVKGISIKPSNLKISTDVDGNQWVHFNVERIPPTKSVEMTYSAVVESRPLIISKENGFPYKINPYSKQFLKKFLVAEPHIESDHPEIKKLALSIASENPLGFAKKAVQLINRTLKYKIQPDEFGAKYAIEKGEGDCTEFSALFVALCRANGIPARTNAGFAFVQQWERHATAEFLVGGRWLPIDITGQNGDDIFIGHLPTNIILSRGNWMGGTITKEVSYRYQILEQTQKLDVDIDWKISAASSTQIKSNAPITIKEKTIKILEPTLTVSNKVKIIDEKKTQESVIKLKKQMEDKKLTSLLEMPKGNNSVKPISIQGNFPDVLKDGLLENHSIYLINNTDSTQRGCFEIRLIEDGIIKLLTLQGVKIPPKGTLQLKPKLQLYKEGINNLSLVYLNRIGRSITSEVKQLSVY